MSRRHWRDWLRSGAGRHMLVLSLAACAGLLAAWSAARQIQGRMDDLTQQAQVPLADRLVAAQDLPEGIRLDPGSLAVRAFPQAWISADALPADAQAQLDGKVLAHAVRGGDPVTLAHLAQPRLLSLSARLAPGRRAVSVPASDLGLEPGLLSPGDKLDIYVSFDRLDQRVTAPLLQSATVIATGTRQDVDAAASETDYASVTFDLAPPEAVKLLAARESGSLTSILRHPDDVGPGGAVATGGLAALLGMPPPAAAKPAPQVLYGDAPGLSSELATDFASEFAPELAIAPDQADGDMSSWAGAARPAGAVAPPTPRRGRGQR